MVEKVLSRLIRAIRSSIFLHLIFHLFLFSIFREKNALLGILLVKLELRRNLPS